MEKGVLLPNKPAMENVMTFKARLFAKPAVITVFTVILNCHCSRYTFKPAVKLFASAGLLVGDIVIKKPVVKTVFIISLAYDSSMITITV